MTKKQREEIENFIKQDISIMKFPQAQAIAQVILENHDMLEKLTGSEQTKEQSRDSGRDRASLRRIERGKNDKKTT